MVGAWLWVRGLGGMVTAWLWFGMFDSMIPMFGDERDDATSE